MPMAVLCVSENINKQDALEVQLLVRCAYDFINERT